MEWLQHLFGCGGTTEAAKELVEGNLLTMFYDPMTLGGTTLLSILGNKSSFLLIDYNIDIPTFIKALKLWSEGTSTSLSRHHLGHNKCMPKMVCATPRGILIPDLKYCEYIIEQPWQHTVGVSVFHNDKQVSW
jgi:hypothetical protein